MSKIKYKLMYMYIVDSEYNLLDHAKINVRMTVVHYSQSVSLKLHIVTSNNSQNKYLF